MTEAGLESLGWLADLQRSDAGGGHFVPIGSNGFYEQGGERARFDQQPVEAQAMVSACLEAYRITGDKRWHKEARRAFEWFLGRNDLNLPIYDPTTGRLPGWPAPRPAEREPGRGIDAGLSPVAAGAATGRESLLVRWRRTISMNNQHPELFRRHSAIPILTAADWPYPVNSVFNPGATLLRRRHHPAVVPCGGPPRPFPSLRGPLRQRRGRLADRPAAHPVARPGALPGRTVGHRRSRASPSSPS